LKPVGFFYEQAREAKWLSLVALRNTEAGHVGLALQFTVELSPLASTKEPYRIEGFFFFRLGHQIAPLALPAVRVANS
jgi:hypothetical protein